MTTVDRSELKALMDGDDSFRLIEVLPPDAYHEWHLPGAENVPLGPSFEDRIQDAVPDKEEKVVLYCSNSDCPASENAAEKMEALGYENIMDYAAGKEDWQAAGLSVES